MKFRMTIEYTVPDDCLDGKNNAKEMALKEQDLFLQNRSEYVIFIDISDVLVEAIHYKE